MGEKVNEVIRQETIVPWSGATTVYMWTSQGTEGTSRRKKTTFTVEFNVSKKEELKIFLRYLA